MSHKKPKAGHILGTWKQPKYTSIDKWIHKMWHGTSLVVQLLRIHLPTQGTGVGSLVGQDPTCHRAMKPMHSNH